jgi:hypothetical protein
MTAMHRRAALAAGWGLYGLALLAPAASAEPDRFWQYDVLVDRYRQGHHGESVQDYAAAVAVDERNQTAWLGLSQVRWRLGDAPGAVAALQPIVAQTAPASGYMDPWWLYPWGQRARADAMLEDLRKEVSP